MLEESPWLVGTKSETTGVGDLKSYVVVARGEGPGETEGGIDGDEEEDIASGRFSK